MICKFLKILGYSSIAMTENIWKILTEEQKIQYEEIKKNQVKK